MAIRCIRQRGLVGRAGDRGVSEAPGDATDPLSRLQGLAQSQHSNESTDEVLKVQKGGQ